MGCISTKNVDGIKYKFENYENKVLGRYGKVTYNTNEFIGYYRCLKKDIYFVLGYLNNKPLLNGTLAENIDFKNEIKTITEKILEITVNIKIGTCQQFLNAVKKSIEQEISKNKKELEDALNRYNNNKEKIKKRSIISVKPLRYSTRYINSLSDFLEHVEVKVNNRLIFLNSLNKKFDIFNNFISNIPQIDLLN